MYVQFNFSSGTLKSDIIISTYSMTEALHNKLKFAEDSAKFSIPYNKAIADKLRTLKTRTKAYVKNDSGTTLFLGFIRPSFTFTKKQRNQPIAIELVSMSDILDVDLPKPISYINKSLSYVINSLLSFTDYSGGTPTYPESISGLYVIEDEGANVKDIFENILEEIGWTYDFGTNGKLQFIDLRSHGSGSTVFDGSNILNQLSVKRSEQECDGIKIKWNQYAYKSDILLWQMTDGGTELKECSVEIPAKSYLWADQADSDGYLFFEYDSSFGEVVATDSTYCSYSWSHTTTATEKLVYNGVNYGTRVKARLYNPNSVKVTLTKFHMCGNGYIKTETAETKTTEGSKYKDVDFKYLTGQSLTERRASQLLNYYKYANDKITLTSKENIDVNKNYTITEDGVGTYQATCIKKIQKFLTPTEFTYDYTFESYDQFSPNVQTNHIKKYAYIPINGEDGEHGFNCATLYLYKRSASAPTSTGITSDATYTFSEKSFEWVDGSGTNGWSTSIPSGNNPLYITSATASTNTESDTIKASEWSVPALLAKNGINGSNGTNGSNGINTATLYLYQRSATQPTVPTGTMTYTFATGILVGAFVNWSQSIPETDGNPVWVTTATALGNGATDTIASTEWSTPVKMAEDGIDGQKGDKGDKGDSGVGIKSVTEYYLVSSSSSGVTTSTSGWTTTIQTITASKKYLWNYEKITYTDSTTSSTAPAIIGAYGNTGATGAKGDKGDTGAKGATGATGSAGVGIKSIEEYYLASTSNSGISTSTSGWTTTIQTVSNSKKYLWNYEKITYTNNTSMTTTPIIIGVYGDKGDTGAKGEKGDKGDKGDTGAKGDNYWMSTLWVDLSSPTYNQETWYPVVGTALSSNGVQEIKVSVQLNSGTTPIWSTHGSGFAVDFHVQDQRSGWGTTSAVCLKFVDTFNWTKATSATANLSPVSYTQMTNSSLPVLYLRGGGKYLVSTTYSCSWSIKTSTYTSNSQSVSPSVSARPSPRGTYIQGAKGDKGDTGATGAKGATGSQGVRGAQYRGAFSSAPTSSLVSGDWYLLTTNGYCYYYNGSGWTQITSYTDYRYLQAMEDMINLSATLTSNANLKTAVNNWVGNLVAGTALIDKLSTKTLNLQSGGVLKSSNFSSGSSGFKIDTDGNAEFNSGRFRGGLGTNKGVCSYNYNPTVPVPSTISGYIPTSGHQKISITVGSSLSGTSYPVADLDNYFCLGKGVCQNCFSGEIYDPNLTISEGFTNGLSVTLKLGTIRTGENVIVTANVIDL